MNDDIMGKQNMAQLYRGILIGNKKEYSNDTCCNGDEKGKNNCFNKVSFCRIILISFSCH